jgi:hypothetical protein
MISVRSLGIVAVCVCLLAARPTAAAEGLRFDVSIVPGVDRHLEWLAYPGYGTIAINNLDVNFISSGKLLVTEEGARAEARNAFLRFKSRKGEILEYEAGMLLGIGSSRLTFPVVIDTSATRQGKLTVTITPPLSSTFPKEMRERIEAKAQLIINPDAQRKLVEYLDALAKSAPRPEAFESRVEALLLDAYNRGSGPAIAGVEVGDDLPISDKWLLTLTLMFWLTLAIPLVARQIRRMRSS